VEVQAKGGSFRVPAGESWSSEHLMSRDAEARPAEAIGSPRVADVARANVDPEKSPIPTSSGAGPRKGATRAGGSAHSTPASATAKADGASAAFDREGESNSPGRTSQEVYETAARLEVNDAAKALALYRSLESGQDSWAQNALFAHGRLEATRGNHAEARRVL